MFKELGFGSHGSRGKDVQTCSMKWAIGIYGDRRRAGVGWRFEVALSTSERLCILSDSAVRLIRYERAP